MRTSCILSLSALTVCHAFLSQEGTFRRRWPSYQNNGMDPTSSSAAFLISRNANVNSRPMIIPSQCCRLYTSTSSGASAEAEAEASASPFPSPNVRVEVTSSEVMTPLHEDALLPSPAPLRDASTSTLNNNNNNSPSTAHDTMVDTYSQQQQQQQQQQQEDQTQLPPPTPFPQNAAKTIDGRLLCASQSAYDLTHPYFQSAAYRPATVAKRISRGVNSVLIGQTYDGITISFRGTQTSNPLDWIQNAALFLTPVDSISGGVDKSGKKTVKVHTGFYRATKSLWKPLKNVLKDMLVDCEERGWKKEIYLTGHSKGGAMASVAALLMKNDKDLPDPEYVCCFASARVGDSAFRDYYNKRINQTSYEAHLDLIPFLPPSASNMETMNEDLTEMIEGMLWSETSSKKKDTYKWDYQAVGTRKFINEMAQIVDVVDKELDEGRIRDFEEGSILSLGEFRAAHCSSCPDDGCNGLYFRGVAGDICALCEDDDDDEDDETSNGQ